jgi:predicted PurR-regulated permease PerM
MTGSPGGQNWFAGGFPSEHRERGGLRWYVYAMRGLLRCVHLPPNRQRPSAASSGEVRPGRSADDLTRSILIGVLTLVGTVAALALALQLREFLAVLLLGIVVGTTLGPFVDSLARYRIPRLLSGVVVYVVLAGIISAFLGYAIPELAGEVQRLADQLDDFESDYNRLADVSPLPPWDDVQPFLQERLERVAGEVASQAVVFVNAVILTFTVFVVGLFWTISRQPAGDLFLSLLEERHRERAEHTLAVMGTRLRRYMLAEFAGMTAIGVLTYIGLTIIGMPYAFSLAAIAFLLEILPILGPWLAFIPALLVALSEGWTTTLLVCVLYLTLQQVESYVIVPVFHRRGTGMPELLILTAVLSGGSLMGILGALIALPMAVIGYTLFMEVFVPWRHARIDANAPDAQPG